VNGVFKAVWRAVVAHRAVADVTYRENELWGPSRTVADIQPWTGSTPPSARDCRRLLADRAVTWLSPFRTGAFCVATHTGGFAYVGITGDSSWGIDPQATVLR